MVAIASLGLAAGTAQAQAPFTDDFQRADSATVGNGWIEKSPNAFSITAGRLAKQPVGSGYLDNLVYRPAAEDLLDVEAATEIRFATTGGYPQLFARLQSSTAALGNWADGYMLYLNGDATSFVLGRQLGSAFVTTLATFTVSPALNTTDTYRMRLRATGTNPVLLAAYVERFSGSAWQVIGQTTFSDTAAQRIVLAGSVGVSGYLEANYSYDNFSRTNLAGASNPVPTTSSLAPNSALAGESGLTVTVAGTGFVAGSEVRWNGAARTTTLVSATTLEAAISAADLAAAGTATVTVFSPAPGGGTSNSQTFTIIANPNPNPVPVATSLSPSTATAGGAAFTLTVNGSSFATGAAVRWNGANRTTTFVSANQLQAAISAADLASSGTASVTVFNPTPGGGTSGALTFTISGGSSQPGTFTDNFNRADSTAIGNGWLEKTDSAFTLAANEAAKATIGGNDYRNNIVYRPAAENLLDAEASVELRFLSLPAGYPQVMVRVQTGTAATAGALDAYLLYVADSPTQAVLSRQRGSAFDTALATINLSAALNTTDRYRLRLSASGTSPVLLNGYVERLNGGVWQILGQASFSDTAAERISTSGSVGFGGFTETNYRYDNFVRTDLSVPNPAPTATTLAPSTVTAGSAATNITVTGTNFVPGSLGRWNGADRTTTFISATQVSVQLTAADLATSGAGTLTVFNPAPGGGTSAGLTLTISAPANNPVPGATSLAPSSANAGAAAFTLTVNGTNFVAGSTVRWNGNNRTTTFVSATQLQAQIAAADIAAAGTAAVTVFNPAPGGGTSGSLTFTINTVSNPAPVASSLNPASTNSGSAAFTLTVNGSNFVSGSQVRWNGANRTTIFVSATQLQAQIAAADVSAAGTAAVTVFTPTPGGGTSASLTFTITAANNPVPTLAALNPSSTTEGNGAFTLTVTGTNFVTGSVVRWNGNSRTTTYVSSTSLTAAITAADVSAAGSASVTVFNPTPGGGTSGVQTFTIATASGGTPTLTATSPVSASVGMSSVLVTITGTGFTPTTTARWNGQNRPTTYQSATQVQVTLQTQDLDTDAIGAITLANGALASLPLSFFVIPAGENVFFDGFNRAAGPNIGNNWTEKFPNAFSLTAAGTVTAGDTGSIDYHDTIFYRPAAEDALNVETGVEFIRLPGDSGLHFPQLHGRVQRNTVTQADTLESYIVYIEDFIPAPSAIAFAVQAPQFSVGECIIGMVPLTRPLVVGNRYRLRMSLQGTYPVQMTGIVEEYSNGSWQMHTTGSLTHDANTQDFGYYCPYTAVPNPISTAGTTGVAKWTTPSDAYDNFYTRTLNSGSAIREPAITYIAPASAPAGTGTATVTVYGADFNANSVVRWNGSARVTTFISSTELRATITAADLAASGTMAVTVYNSNAGPGGSVSAQPATFTVLPAATTFTDSFTRADSSTLGNGWIAKTGSIFSLQSGRVVKGGSAVDYVDTLMYRPAVENLRDVEVSTTLRINNTSVGFPQLASRVQTATVATPGALDAYLMFFDGGPSRVVVGRQRGSAYLTELAAFNTTTPLTTAGTYRMRLRTTGDSPVQIEAYIEQLSGSNWIVIGQTVTSDANANRISTAGSVGFGGWVEPYYSFDDFSVINLSP